MRILKRFRLHILFAASFAVGLLSSNTAVAQRQMLQTRSTDHAEAKLLHRMPESQNLRLALTLPLRNQDKLHELLQQLTDPTSPNYRHFLSVQEFADQFGPTQEDYDKVVNFAKSNGLTVTHTYPNRMLVNVAGAPSAVDKAFHVTLQTYRHPTEDREFYAPDVEPTLEAGTPIIGVDGLTNFDLPHPHLTRSLESSAVTGKTTGSGPGGAFLGSDIRAAYAPGVTLDGTGQMLGLVELGPYNLSDVQLYYNTIGQPLNVPIYNVLLDVDGNCVGNPSNGGCDDGEEVIDIEQITSMAPHAAGLVVYEAYGSGSDALTAFTQAATDNIVKVISISFGWGATASNSPGYEQIFMEMQAQGQNVFNAAGDMGANTGNIDYPTNSPNVVDVGGTDLTTVAPGGAWQSESGWVGTEGGWIAGVAIPSYQLPVINSTNQGSTIYRNSPDVAMEANTDSFFCINGYCGGGMGGASLSAPRFAGFIALANQQANGTPVGFLNPTFYSLGQSSSYTSVFHDITTGNNFNTNSPDLYSAEVGYDLVTGWGTPQGQAMIDALAPVHIGNVNFTLSSSVASLNFTPGSTGTSTITVSPVMGFIGTVNLSAQVIGAPIGVTATLSTASIKASGSAVLTIATTSATQGGTYIVAVTGTSGTLSHTTYVQIELPDFALSVSPSQFYINQGDTVANAVTITPINGFNNNVALATAGPLATGVTATFIPALATTSSTLMLTASGTTPIGPTGNLAITGTSGNLQRSTWIGAIINAGTGTNGSGTTVNLATYYNTTGIFKDGKSLPGNGGLDSLGNAFSGNLLTQSRVLYGVLFKLGAPDVADMVAGAGQTIPLTAGKFTTLQFLATAINGEQANQTFTVTYTDGTTSVSTLSISDWTSPAGTRTEIQAVSMPYQDTNAGASNNGPFYLYNYTLTLNNSKTVASVTLPNNSNVMVLAATLTTQSLGTQVNLTSAFNVAGIYDDGVSYPNVPGLDGGSATYSANLIGNQAGASTLFVNDSNFNIGAPNENNAVYGNGGSVPLPSGRFSNLYLLGTGVNGDQAGQAITVTYADGTSAQFTQSFSDWAYPGGYPGESTALSMAYRDLNNGTQQDQSFYLYEYTLPLNNSETVQSLTLPNNRDVLILAATLAK